jgi:predicted transcriptional regulator
MISGRVRSAAIAFFLFILIVPISVAGTGGYVVTPGPDDMAPGTPQDPVPVTFWDLSPRVMALAIVLAFFPVLVCPTEILFGLKMLAALGYLKIAPSAVFQNKNRLRIYEIIRANPGINFPQLSKMIGMKRGPVRYHLMVLCTKRKIIAVPNQATFSYFENGSRFTEFEKTMIRYLQNMTSQMILEILVASPSVSRKDIAGILGVSGPSVTWHTNRLSEGGIITIRKKGRDTRYALTTDASVFFRKYPMPAGVESGQGVTDFSQGVDAHRGSAPQPACASSDHFR